MKWIPLKMNYLPLIFQEINFVTENYINLLNKIRQKTKNIDEQKNFNDSDNEEDPEIIIKKFTALRESISKRINELEEFYEDNIEDVRVSNFEKARIRLKKLLMYSYENINRVENSSQQQNIFIRETNTKKITEDDKKILIENNINMEKQPKVEKKKIIKSENKGGASVNKKNKKKANEGDKYVKYMEKEKKNYSSTFGKNSDASFDEASKCREVIFRIKLNPDEYNLLLKEKKNPGKVSAYLFK